MDKVEKIRQEIERLKEFNRSMADNAFNSNMRNFYDGKKDCCKQILSFLDTLSEEPDKSLEEAANEFCKTIFHKPFSENPQEEQIVYDGDRYVGFIAGAKWQADHTPLPEDTVIFQKGIAEGKRLMLEDAVEGFVATHLTSEGTKITVNSGYLPKEMCIKPGEKVRIIVCKKED